jgi:uncharacterized membrane protein YbhN (UPF0104 family)
MLAASGRHRAAQAFTTDRPPRREVLEAQLTGTALNRLVPAGAGVLATQTRLLQRRGQDRTCIAAAIGAYAAGGALAHGLLVAGVGIAVLSGAVALPAHPHLPTVGAPVLVVVLLAGLVFAALFRARARRVLKATRDTVSAATRAVGTRPGTIARLTGLQIASQLLMVLGLFAALSATGTSVSLMALLVMYVASNSVTSALPTPGGLGPVEAGLVGGLMLLAVPLAAAATAVALFRAVTYWLPVPLGIAVAVTSGRRERRLVHPLRTAAA